MKRVTVENRPRNRAFRPAGGELGRVSAGAQVVVGKQVAQQRGGRGNFAAGETIVEKFARTCHAATSKGRWFGRLESPTPRREDWFIQRGFIGAGGCLLLLCQALAFGWPRPPDRRVSALWRVQLPEVFRCDKAVCGCWQCGGVSGRITPGPWLRSTGAVGRRAYRARPARRGGGFA